MIPPADNEIAPRMPPRELKHVGLPAVLEPRMKNEDGLRM